MRRVAPAVQCHAHYADHVDLWVALHSVSDGNMYGPRMTDGHLCASNVTSAPHESKVGKENLFCLDEDAAVAWSHVKANLVPMASSKGNTEYNLMEHLRPDVDDKEEEIGVGDKCLL